MEERINLIKENKEEIVAGLTAFLDEIYNLTDAFFQEDGETLKEDLDEDKGLIDFVKTTRSQSGVYENIRLKLIEDDFDLSEKEVIHCGLALFFAHERLKDNIEKSFKLIKKIAPVMGQLIGNKNLSLYGIEENK